MMNMDDWESKPLFELLDLIMDFRGRTPKKLDMEWGGGEIPALSANNVEMGKINFLKECYLASDALYRKWMTKGDIQKGDVVLTTEAPLGNVATIPDDRRYILSQRVILLRASSSKLYNDYLSHYLMSEGFQNLMRQQSSGTTATGIQRAKLEPLLINFPTSKIEQTKIAEILSTIDRAIAQTEAIIAKQQRIKTGLMQDLLTKGIDENGNIRSEATHEFKDSAIGRIPVEWDVRKIGELSYIENGTTPSRENPIFWHEGTIPWLTTGQVHDRFILQSNEFISEYALRLCSLKILPVGTILIAMIGQGLTRGKVAYLGVKSSINQYFAAIIPSLLFNSRFLFHYLDFNYEYVRGASQGSNQQALNSSVVSNLKVVYPPLQEQNHISNIVDVYDNCIYKEETYLIKLKQQKTGLMQDLLTGKVRVTNLLNEREPASL